MSPKQDSPHSARARELLDEAMMHMDTLDVIPVVEEALANLRADCGELGRYEAAVLLGEEIPITVKLRRVEAGKYTAFDGRYTVLQEPEAVAGGPRMWLVYNETYGGMSAGICMEPLERLRDVKPELEVYHREVLLLEGERDSEALPDYRRAGAAVRLRGELSREQVAEEFDWTVDRAIAALEHPEQRASRRHLRPFGSDPPASRSSASHATTGKGSAAPPAVG